MPQVTNKHYHTVYPCCVGSLYLLPGNGISGTMMAVFVRLLHPYCFLFNNLTSGKWYIHQINL